MDWKRMGVQQGNCLLELRLMHLIPVANMHTFFASDEYAKIVGSKNVIRVRFHDKKLQILMCPDSPDKKQDIPLQK